MCRWLTICFLILAVHVVAHGQAVIEKTAISIGGIKQWISINGTDVNDPVLLHLHGGPGNSVMSTPEKFMNEMQKHFVVVQWDQRESGETADTNPTDKPLTVSLMESDAVEVITYLCKRFSRDKIYLMGHSWGGFLALKIAHDHPDLLLACFSISPMVDQVESEKRSLAWMKDKAKKVNNQIALKELALVKIPFETGDQLYSQRKWLALFDLRQPPAKDFVLKWSDKWLPLYNEACRMNLFSMAPEIECPVYFFVGARDRITYFKVTESYFKMLKAKKKDLFWFNNSGHSPNTTEPAKLQEIIISLVSS